MKLMSLTKRRHLIEVLYTSFALLSFALVMLLIALILWTLIKKGAHVFFTLPVLSASTPAPGLSGGLLNAIYGSLTMTLSAMLMSTPIGILIAYYFIDGGRGRRLTQLIRFFNDVLLSVPSIIVGLFIYIILVRTMGHFSAWSGAFALAIIALPIIVRASEDALALVADPLREAAYALGTPRWRVAWLIIYHGGKTGILTATLLAGSRIFGEAAPLLFTALNNQFFTTNMNHPMANLPVVIFQFALSPYENWQNLAWAGALLLTLMVLITNLAAQYLSAERRIK